MPKVALFLLLFLSPLSSFALPFSNKYLSFELPQNWTCKEKGQLWTCVSYRPKEEKQAKIIFLVATADSTDTLENFVERLKVPRFLKQSNGTAPSLVLGADKRLIRNHPWVDAMHLSSEVHDYYSRYLMTIKDGVVIFVTFNAHKLHYSEYTHDFHQAVESLKFTDPKSIQQYLSEAEQLGAEEADPFPAQLGEPSSGRSYMRYILGGLFLLSAVAAFYVWQKKS